MVRGYQPSNGTPGFDRYREAGYEPIPPLSAKPIIVGHSFGGLLAEQLLVQDAVAAAVAIDPRADQRRTAAGARRLKRFAS